MKKIYLISYYFAPLGRADGVNRTLFVRGLTENGWDIEVITGKNYQSLFLNFQKDVSLLDDLPSSVKIHRFTSDNKWLIYDFKKFFHIKNNFRTSWISEIIKNFHPGTPGIVMGIVPPHDNAMLAYQLSIKYNFPLALYYTDEILDVPDNIVRHAKTLICVTPQIMESLKKTYNHPNIVLIEQGMGGLIDCPIKESVHFPIKMVYAGSFNFRTSPELIGKAFRQLTKQHPNLKESLVIDLYGPQGYYLWLFLKPFLGKNIQYKGYMPFHRLLQNLPEYDMALTINRADVAFPSKVYHYLNAGLPIFAITEHAGLINFIHGNSIGLTSDNDIDNITNQLVALLTNKDLLLEWRKNVLSIRSNHELKKQLLKFEDALKTQPNI